MSLFVGRLLDPRENSKIPQFKIKGDVTSVEFFVSEAQAILLFAILNENVKAGMKPTVTDTSNETQQTTVSKSKPTPTEAIEEVVPDETSSFIKADVSFNLKKIGLHLLRGLGTTRGKHDIRNGLASFFIDDMAAIFLMQVDSSMNVILPFSFFLFFFSYFFSKKFQVGLFNSISWN